MKVLAAIAFLLFTAVSAAATPISYTLSSFGSGSLNGVAFGAAAPVAFILTSIGDTTNVVSCGAGCLSNDNTSSSINIAGVGTFAITLPTRYFSSSLVGFSRTGASGADLIYTGGASGWNMVTSIGPITNTGSLLQWAIAPQVTTSGGILIFNSAAPQVTFQAVVAPTAVPEPTTLLLLATGVAAIRLRRRPRG